MFYDRFIRKIYIKRLVKHGLKLGSNFQIEKGANIDAVFPSLITIGDNVTLAKDVYILAHDGASKKIIGYTKVSPVNINNNVFIGAKSIVMPGVEIGENSVIAAHSLVNKPIPSNQVWGGIPAKFICTIDAYKSKIQEQFAQFKCPLLLNGKKTYNMNKQCIDEFMENIEIYGVGFIE